MSIGFEDLVDLDTNNLLVIDSLNMAFRWRKTVTGWSHKLVSTITSLASSYKARDVIVLGDGGSTYRKAIYPDYKGNRNKDDQAAEKQEWTDFFMEYEEAMRIVASQYPILKFKGVEADDIVAYLVKRLYEEYNHIWMISSDRDWDLLIGPTVSRFSLFSKKEFTNDNFEEHYCYPLHMHIDVKVLNGDTGDNIPGVMGVGPKRAVAILEKYGPTAMDVMDALPVAGTAKYIQELNKFEDKILLNYELMDLVAYADTAVKDYKSQIDLYIKNLLGGLDNLPQISETITERKERMEDDI